MTGEGIGSVAAPGPASRPESDVERLRKLCAMASESGNTRGLREVAEWLAAELRPLGLSSSIEEGSGAGGVRQPILVARGPESGGKHLLLIGHLDTVLTPVEPRVESARLVGTGALDMKGGLAMFVGALERLQSRGQALPQDLVFVAVPDEEAEGVISTECVNRWSRDARAVLVLEPGMAIEGGKTLVAGRRGLTEWRLEVTGRSAHSGLAYWKGRSALAAAADFCARAQALSERDQGPTVNVSRLVGGSAGFVDHLELHHGMMGTSRQLNVVPDRARAEGELRFLSPSDGRRWSRGWSHSRSGSATTIRWRPGSPREPPSRRSILTGRVHRSRAG